MTTLTQVVGTRTSLPFTSTSLSTLAAGNYVQNTTAYNCATNNPVDVVIEVDVSTTNTPSGNKQVVVYIRESLDGTNYRSGPTSGSSTTDEPNLKPLGAVPLASSSTPEVGLFSVATVLGFVPKSFFIVIKDDLGVALTGGTVWTSEISNPIV